MVNEDLNSVTCTFYRDRGEGMPRAYFKISLTYQKIELSDLDSGASAFDHGLLIG